MNADHKVHSFFNLLSMADTTDNNRPKINAHRNPSIEIPETNLSANRMMSTLITSKNSPSVMMVNGRVSMMISGFTRKLSTANTNAKIIAVVKD